MEDEKEMKGEGGRKKRGVGEEQGRGGRKRKRQVATPWLHFSLLAAPAEEPAQLHAESGHSGTRSGQLNFRQQLLRSAPVPSDLPAPRDPSPQLGVRA